MTEILLTVLFLKFFDEDDSVGMEDMMEQEDDMDFEEEDMVDMYEQEDDMTDMMEDDDQEIVYEISFDDEEELDEWGHSENKFMKHHFNMDDEDEMEFEDDDEMSFDDEDMDDEEMDFEAMMESKKAKKSIKPKGVGMGKGPNVKVYHEKPNQGTGFKTKMKQGPKSVGNR